MTPTTTAAARPAPFKSFALKAIKLSFISRITLHPEQVKAVIDWLLGCQSSNILSMATLHPDQPEGKANVEALKKAGFKGIKLDTAFVIRIMDESILSIPLNGFCSEPTARLPTRRPSCNF
jgi:hypothetical protein